VALAGGRIGGLATRTGGNTGAFATGAAVALTAIIDRDALPGVLIPASTLATATMPMRARLIAAVGAAVPTMLGIGLEVGTDLGGRGVEEAGKTGSVDLETTGIVSRTTTSGTAGAACGTTGGGGTGTGTTHLAGLTAVAGPTATVVNALLTGGTVCESLATSGGGAGIGGGGQQEADTAANRWTVSRAALTLQLAVLVAGVVHAGLILRGGAARRRFGIPGRQGSPEHSGSEPPEQSLEHPTARGDAPQRAC
jgi:hypothetical protein